MLFIHLQNFLEDLAKYIKNDTHRTLLTTRIILHKTSETTTTTTITKNIALHVHLVL